MLRVDGETGTTVLWSRGLTRRWGVAVPDVNGDGQYDFFAVPSYYSSTVKMLDGSIGQDIWSVNYGSFDVLGGAVVVDDIGCGVIASAQGSSRGGIRRYNCSNGDEIWTCLSTYNNNTLMQGVLRRADGLTLLSGWRHRGKAIALDVATGEVLWDNVPANNADFVGIGIPDLTGDGSDDFLAINSGWVRLYDGVTGVEQTWFPPIAVSGNSVAYDSVP